MDHELDDSSQKAAEFIDRALRPFGFGDRWAFQALHEDGGWYGLSESRVRRLCSSAEVLINLHGGTEPLPEHYETGRLVFLETDPVDVQVQLAQGRRETVDYLAPHCAFFSFGENYGRPSCGLPVSSRFDFRPTRQPVVLDFWSGGPPHNGTFTTVANWRQLWRDLEFEGEVYSWSKETEFRKVLDLPRRVGSIFELALGSTEDEDRRLLVEHGWRLRDPAAISAEPDTYRDYIIASRGEFTVAKDQNVRLLSGWFSDRSATYLAAGRPVVTQDTGFGCALPTGEGLLAFTTLDDAVAAVEAVRSDYDRHSRAAAEIAREHFAAERVLGRLLEDIGAPRISRRLSLQPVSRRPTTLPAETEAAVRAATLPPPMPEPSLPEVSAVVVACDGLPFTRLALESILGSVGIDLEVIVVDNASEDGTGEYLRSLAASDQRVRPIRHAENLGFAAGVNAGLAATRGEALVVLNNDVVVPPAALARLVGHLGDPALGLVGPISNEAATEAEVDEDWGTYGELLARSGDRARERRGRLLDVEMLTMFCVAMRRDVFERVGLVDERFEVGLFEDDDYSLRIREQGLRVVVAEDVLVHHFGEAAIGKLVPTGEYAAIFEVNRHRFEKKWGKPWEQHGRRPSEAYIALVERMRQIVAEMVPTDARLLVVSRGDEELLELEGRAAQHFPQLDDGTYAGHYPADSTDAIDQLERLRTAGADYLLFPKTSFWWLDHYPDFRRHLEERYGANEDSDTCVIFRLNGGTYG
jgi:GT2 family glycosyltransferase